MKALKRADKRKLEQIQTLTADFHAAAKQWCQFQHIFSGEIASASINDSLTNIRESGNKRVEDYIKCCITREMSMREGQKRPYKFIAVKNFGESRKKSRHEKTYEQFHKSTADFHATVIQWCQFHQIPPDDIEQFINLPMSIATPDGLPVQKQKADAIKYF